MTTKTLNRSSSLLIISGVLLGVGMLFHPDMANPDAATRNAWIPVHVVLGISALLGLVGLAGLYAVLSLNMRTLGRAAFGLAMLANVLLTGMLFFVEAGIVPVLARDSAYRPLLSETGPLLTGGFGLVIVTTMTIAAIGFLCLAGYLMSTKTISLANGLLFLGAPLLAFTPPLPFAFGIIGGVLLGAGITWLGISIRKGTAHDALASSLRMQDECFLHAGGHA